MPESTTASPLWSGGVRFTNSKQYQRGIERERERARFELPEESSVLCLHEMFFLVSNVEMYVCMYVFAEPEQDDVH